MSVSPRPLHVLHVITWTPNGRYFRDLIPALLAEGHKVTLVSMAPLDAVEWAESLGVSVHSLGGTGWLRIPAAIRALRSLVRNLRPDVVQSHLFEAGLVAIAACRLTKTPLVFTRHHIDEHVQAGTPVHRRLDRWSLAHVTRVITFSEAARRWLIEREGANPAIVDRVYQGFDFAPLSPSADDVARARTELAMDGKTTVVYVARYFPTKGHTFVLQAIESLRSRVPDLRVLFIGPGDHTSVVAERDARGLGGVVDVLGPRSDIPAVLAAADFVMHPSLAEAFCQTIVEAMAVGSALIATDVAAAREQITDGVEGLVVAPRDPAALADAIARLAGDPALRATLGAAASESVRRRYTVAQMVEGTVASYRRALSDSPESSILR